MKLLVSWSGGKDSQASLIYAIKGSGFPIENIEAVFCDTGWEHEYTYKHVKDVCEDLGVKLVTLQNPKYNGMVDLSKKKGLMPSTKARFCTQELKIKPMIDYVLTHKQHLLIYQGIRSDESLNRSKMQEQCTFFKYYFQPYQTNSMIIEAYSKIDNPNKSQKSKYFKAKSRLQKGKEDAKFHTYRKMEVIEFCKKYSDDISRPVFLWTGEEVMSYIIVNGQQPNPLYFQGMKRVGCFPCIMCTQAEISNIVKYHPKYIERLDNAEKEADSSFFRPDFIPPRYNSHRDKNGKRYNRIADVVRYINDKNATGDLFENTDDELNNHRCMSYYNICE